MDSLRTIFSYMFVNACIWGIIGYGVFALYRKEKRNKKAVKKLRTSFKLAISLNVVVWLLVVGGYFAMSMSAGNKRPHDDGIANAIEETEHVVPATVEEIEIINDNIIKTKEREVNAEREEAQRKSREDYNNFINGN